MNKRPLPVILISCLFIAAGAMGIIYHVAELTQMATNPEMILVLGVRLLAIVGGIYALRGMNWARWLLLAWISYHVVISFFHTSAELIMHAVFMMITIAALFLPKANVYFRKEN
jgi:hypothetical protein